MTSMFLSTMIHRTTLRLDAQPVIQVIPGSDHTPPDSSPSPSSHSSQSWPLPILPRVSQTPPIHIWISPTVTKAWCYEFFSSLTRADHAFYFSFSFMIYMHYPQGWHAFIHVPTSFLPYVLQVFASWLTHFSYLFKPVVRQLYSLAFH